jgi:hypothetical protein
MVFIEHMTYNSCKSLGAMDHVQRTLHEAVEKVATLKKGQIDIESKLMVERTKTQCHTRKLRDEMDKHAMDQHELLDKARHKEHADFAKKIEKEQLAHLKKVLYDQRAMFSRRILEERAHAQELLRLARKENDDNIKKERAIFESLNKDATERLAELESVIQSLFHLVQQQEIQVNMLLY